MVLVAAILWGTVGPAQVLAGSDASPTALGGARLLTGGLLLFLLALRGGLVQSVVRRAPGPLIAASLATAVFQAVFFTSVARTGAALATAVALGVTPVATGIYDWLANRAKLDRAWLLGTLAAIAGCVLLLLPGKATGVDPLGVGLGIVAGACYGVYTVSAKQLVDAGADMVTAVSLTLLAGGVLFVPWMLTQTAQLASRESVLLVAWLSIAATALAYMLFVHGLRRVSASAAGTLSLAEPLVAAFLGVWILGEHLSPVALGGCVLLLAGLATVTSAGSE